MIELAARLDQVILLPGWEDIVKYMAEQVQREIAKATQYIQEPDRMAVQCTIWNSKRDLLDTTLGYIEAIRRSRDEIVQQYKSPVETT